MNLIVFISGKASAGKDTFAKSLLCCLKNNFDSEILKSKEDYAALFNEKKDTFNFGGVQVTFAPFADEVRRELCRLQPDVSFEALKYDYVYKTKFRKEMIDIGHGYRQKDPLIWVKKHGENINPLLNSGTPQVILVPDTRYQNEMAYGIALSNMFEGKVFSYSARINATLLTRLNRMSPEGAKTYLAKGRYNPGECELDVCNSFDFIGENNHMLDCPYAQYKFFEDEFEHLVGTFKRLL